MERERPRVRERKSIGPCLMPYVHLLIHSLTQMRMCLALEHLIYDLSFISVSYTIAYGPESLKLDVVVVVIEWQW